MIKKSAGPSTYLCRVAGWWRLERKASERGKGAQKHNESQMSISHDDLA